MSRARLAVSNIAWDRAEDDRVAAILRREGVTGVEIAPTTWREHPLEAPSADIAALRREWNDRGLAIASLQALLFGRPELQLFGSEASRTAMRDHLARTIDFAAALGASALVFGSPKNRQRGAVSPAAAREIAIEFFQSIGEYACERGTLLCLEANPPEYGCDFITTTAEAVDLCRAIDRPAIRVNGDIGGITLSGDDPYAALLAAGPLLGHVHASEPNLAELGARADHARAAAALATLGYDRWISIEMRAAGGGANVEAVERALRVAKAAYS